MCDVQKLKYNIFVDEPNTNGLKKDRFERELKKSHFENVNLSIDDQLGTISDDMSLNFNNTIDYTTSVATNLQINPVIHSTPAFNSNHIIASKFKRMSHMNDLDEIFNQPFISNAYLDYTDEWEDASFQSVYFYDPKTANLVPTSLLQDDDVSSSTKDNNNQTLLLKQNKGIKLKPNRKCTKSSIIKKTNSLENSVNTKKVSLPIFTCLFNPCERNFHTEAEMRKHMLVHTLMGRLCCPYGCEITFQTREELNMHEREHMKSSVSNKMSKQQIEPSSSSEVIVESTTITPKKCSSTADNCNTKRLNKTTIMNDNHGERIKPESHHEMCDKILTVTTSTNNLTVHSKKQKILLPKKNKNVKSPIKELKYCCTFADCERRFHRSDVLREHERIHLGIRPYFCQWEECKFNGVSSYRVVEHIRKVHFGWRHGRPVNDDRNPHDHLQVRKELL